VEVYATNTVKNEFNSDTDNSDTYKHAHEHACLCQYLRSTATIFDNFEILSEIADTDLA